MASTVLVILGADQSPYATRGLTQKLDMVDSAVATRRTINGVLRNVTAVGFEKWKTTISGDDHEPPAFEELQPGAIVTMHCISEFSVAGPEPADLSTWDGGTRPVVPGSVSWQAGFISYRPILTMMVVNRSVETDEWGHTTSWSIDLEEV